MRALRAWLQRAAGMFSGRRDREFDEELRAHLDMHAEDNRRQGMSPDEAARVALARLGGVQQARERYHDRAGLPALETIVKDVQFALRLMRRGPLFTAIVLATLAIGIGGNAVMFGVVNAVLLRPLPYADPGRLVMVRPVDGAARVPSFAAVPDFDRYRGETRTLERLDAFYGRAVNLTGGIEPERVTALIVSPGFLHTLGVAPALGAGFHGEHGTWGAHRVVLLSDGLWRRRFGANPAVAGETAIVNGEAHQVLGVLPPAFSFLNADVQVYLPMAFAPGDNMNSRNNYFLRMVGRLRPGATREQALSELTTISDAIIAQHQINRESGIGVEPLQEALVANVRQPMLVLLGAVAFVLLIACANLASLLLARAVSRQREITVRLAMGATRARLLRQFLIESLLLSLAGGAIGFALAFAATDAVNLISPQVLPRAEAIRLDQSVLLFTFAVATATGLLLGLAPALHGGRTPLAQSLRETSRSTSHGTLQGRLRGAMVVAEVALSLVLLAGAGLMIKSLYQMLSVDLGFRGDRVLTLQINLPPQKYLDQDLMRRFDPRAYVRATAFFDELLAHTRALPGVEVAGAINGLPLAGEIWSKNATLFDRPLPADLSGLAPIQYRVVSGDYFRALGVAIVSGRAFIDRDTAESPTVAVINRAMARRDWPGQDPLGKEISVNPPLQLLPKKMVEEARRSGTLPDGYEPPRFTIVGVVDDARYGGLTTPAVPLVYVPFAQGSEGTTNMFLVVRAKGDPLALAAPIRQAVARIDGDQPVAAVQTMDSRVAAAAARPRLQTVVLAVFAALAILLAAVGIYGVLSYAVSQRAPELGIRLALGAARRDVFALVLRQGLSLVAIGLALGLAAALLLTRVMRTLLFDVSPTDPAVFVTILLLLSAIAAIAALAPARRAARLDPLVTLRNE